MNRTPHQQQTESKGYQTMTAPYTAVTTSPHTSPSTSAEVKRHTRMSALTELISTCEYYTRYKTDLLQVGYDLGTNELPCIVCVRDAGVDVIRYASNVAHYAGIFGDKPGESQWYIGKPGEIDPATNYAFYHDMTDPVYTFTFTRASADECKDFLTTWFDDIE